MADIAKRASNERIAEAGRLVAEALKDARESSNPYAEAQLTQDLAKVGLMRLDVARGATASLLSARRSPSDGLGPKVQC